MVAPVIVVLDEARDLGFEITGQIIVLEQDAVLERLVPALDLALGLRMARGAAKMRDATVLQPFRKIARDVARSVIAEQWWFVHDLGACLVDRQCCKVNRPRPARS